MILDAALGIRFCVKPPILPGSETNELSQNRGKYFLPSTSFLERLLCLGTRTA
jgi:hypothetical protein